MDEDRKELEQEAPEGGAGSDVEGQEDLGGEEWDQARALETIRQQRASEKALEKALKEAKGQLTKLEAAEKKRQQSEMDEVERLKTERDELASRLQALEQEREELILRSAVEREASKLGFHDPADAFGLADLADVQVDGGEVDGVEKALKALAKARPYLLRTVEKPDIDSGKKGGGKQEPDRAGIARRFGI